MRFSLGTALGIEVHGPDLVLAVVRKGFRHFAPETLAGSRDHGDVVF